MTTIPGTAAYTATTLGAPRTLAKRTPGRLVVSWLTSTDHKVIGYL